MDWKGDCFYESSSSSPALLRHLHALSSIVSSPFNPFFPKSRPFPLLSRSSSRNFIFSTQFVTRYSVISSAIPFSLRPFFVVLKISLFLVLQPSFPFSCYLSIVKTEDAFVAVDRGRKNKKKKREKKIEMKILNIETSILNILFCTVFVLQSVGYL